MHNLQKALDQIERDIQTKKLSKEEERKLVATVQRNCDQVAHAEDDS